MSSVIFDAYPSIVPSLYTLNVYVTISPFLTPTGSLFNLYSPVVAIIFPFSSFLFNLLTSTFLILSGTSWSFTATILLINFKSKYPVGFGLGVTLKVLE